MTNFQERLYDAIWESSKTSQAGKDLWRLYNILADDVDGDELFSRLDSYIFDLNEKAQALYLKLVKNASAPV
jgi:hypothetical protein